MVPSDFSLKAGRREAATVLPVKVPEGFPRRRYDEEEETFHGRVNNITDLVIFYGRSVGELKRGTASSIEVYLTLCAEKGIEPQGPTD